MSKITDSTPVGYAPDHPAVLASLNAMALEQDAWEAKRKECYAWLAVVDAVNPDAASNVGERNIRWVPARSGHSPVYEIRFRTIVAGCVNAPSTLEKARTSILLHKAVTKRDQVKSDFREEGGERGEATKFPYGTYGQIRLVLEATEEGRNRLEVRARYVETAASLAATACAYEFDQWCPSSSLTSHVLLRDHPKRVELIARGLSTKDAAEEARALKTQVTAKPNPFRPVDAASPGASRLTPVRAHARGRTEELSEDLKLELGIAYEHGVTFDAVVTFWTSLEQSDVAEAVAA